MIGVDLVFIPEFQKQIKVGGTTFIEKTFHVSEIKNQKVEHLAGLWAAKEAVMKAAETIPKKLNDIIISYDVSGRPHATVGAQEFAVSITHHGDYAVAVAYRLSR